MTAGSKTITKTVNAGITGCKVKGHHEIKVRISQRQKEVSVPYTATAIYFAKTDSGGIAKKTTTITGVFTNVKASDTVVEIVGEYPIN